MRRRGGIFVQLLFFSASVYVVIWKVSVRIYGYDTICMHTWLNATSRDIQAIIRIHRSVEFSRLVHPCWLSFNGSTGKPNGYRYNTNSCTYRGSKPFWKHPVPILSDGNNPTFQITVKHLRKYRGVRITLQMGTANTDPDYRNHYVFHVPLGLTKFHSILQSPIKYSQVWKSLIESVESEVSRSVTKCQLNPEIPKSSSKSLQELSSLYMINSCNSLCSSRFGARLDSRVNIVRSQSIFSTNRI